MNKQVINLFNKLYVTNGLFTQISPISTTSSCHLIQKHRKEKCLPLNSNSYGPLTDLPDYSFLDGRPAPLGMNQKRRKIKQQEIAKRIIQLSNEMDFAVERHAEKVKQEQEEKERIISNKLKPKGHLLLKDK